MNIAGLWVEQGFSPALDGTLVEKRLQPRRKPFNLVIPSSPQPRVRGEGSEESVGLAARGS